MKKLSGWTTSTPTHTATTTPTMEPTGTTSPLPTIAPGAILIVITDPDGNPVSDARVIVSNLGEFTTGPDGTVEIKGLDNTMQYTIFVQKTGIDFSNSTFTAKAGSLVTASGVARNFNPMSCPQTDITSVLIESSQLAQQFSNTIGSILGTGDKDGENSSFTNETLLRTKKQFGNYQNSSISLPEIVLSCDEAACTRRNLRTGKSVMRSELRNLGRGLLLTFRMERVGNSGSRANRVQAARVARDRNKVLRKLRLIPDWSSQCS